MDKKIKTLLFIAFVVLFICGTISLVNAQAPIAFRYSFGVACPDVSGLTLRGSRGNNDDGLVNTQTTCSTNLRCICFYSLL
jgi:Ca2+/Na+ antiporter